MMMTRAHALSFLSVLAPLLLTWPAGAASWPLQQVTDTHDAYVTEISIDHAGTHIAFVSNANFTGENPTSMPQVFAYNIPQKEMVQITHLDGGQIDVPRISGSGGRIVFSSEANITGENNSHYSQLFMVDLSSGELTQLTHTFLNHSPALSYDGSKIAFQSQPAGNLGDVVVFLLDDVSGQVLQLAGNSRHPSIDYDGKIVAFESDADLTGQNLDGNREIFLCRTDTLTLHQITDSLEGYNSYPSISGDGTQVVFDSSSDLTGENADGGREIFLFDVAQGTLRQITRVPTSGSSASFFPSLNSSGTRILFNSYADISGLNPDNNAEVYLFDTVSDRFSQITFSIFPVNHVYRSAISGDGRRTAIRSTADFIAGNSDKNTEAYLASEISTLIWPLGGNRSERKVSLEFGANWVEDCGAKPKIHTGVDLSAEVGEGVYAAHAGVVKAAFEGSVGQASAVTIEGIDTPNAFTTVSWHIDPSVWVGKLVHSGERIGTVADLGSGTHFHFGIRLDDYLNENIANRGALPQINCGDDPLFPEVFTDPLLLSYEERVFSDGFESGDSTRWSSTVP